MFPTKSTRSEFKNSLPRRERDDSNEIENTAERSRKDSKKKKKRRNGEKDADGAHSKEEESARALLEMRSVPAGSVDDQLASALQAEAEKALGGLSHMNDESSKSGKRKDKRKKKDGRTSQPEPDNVTGPTMFPSDSYPFGLGEPDPSFYGLPNSDGVEPYSQTGLNVGNGYENSFAHADSGFTDSNTPYASLAATYTALDQPPVNQQNLTSPKPSNAERKRKRKADDPSVERLENTASAANALIDPQLTGDASTWQLMENGTAPDQMNIVMTGEQDNRHAKPSKRPRRPPPDAHPDSDADPSQPPTTATGAFTNSEVEIVQRYMDEYMQSQKIDQRELADRIWAVTRKRDEFWDEIAKVLPNRPRQSIYKFCRRKYHNFEARGKWTKEDDNELMRRAMEKPNKWKEIGAEMHRMPEDCRDRWRNYLKCGSERNKDTWSETEEAALRQAVHDCIETMKENARNDALSKPGLYKHQELDDEEYINWTVVSEKMGHVRSRLQCLYKWKKLKQRDEREFAEGRFRHNEINLGAPGMNEEPGDTKKTWRIKKAESNFQKMYPGDKLDLLKALRDSGTFEERNLQWKVLAPNPHWSSTDRKTAFGIMKRSVPDYQHLSLQAIVMELMSRFDVLSEEDKEARYVPEPRTPSGADSNPKMTRRKRMNKTPRIVNDSEGRGSDNHMIDPQLQHISGDMQVHHGDQGVLVGGMMTQEQVDQELRRQVELLRNA